MYGQPGIGSSGLAKWLLLSSLKPLLLGERFFAFVDKGTGLWRTLGGLMG